MRRFATGGRRPQVGPSELADAVPEPGDRREAEQLTGALSGGEHVAYVAEPELAGGLRLGTPARR